MSGRRRLLFLLGCVLVVALEVPRTVREVSRDLRGPYARPPAHDATVAERARPAPRRVEAEGSGSLPAALATLSGR